MRIIVIVSILIFILGCASQRPALFLDKRSKGELSLLKTEEAKRVTLNPQEISVVNKDIEITVKHATPEYLESFFKRTDIFNKAKKNPYPREVIVFLVRIVNNRGSRIKVEPHEFIIVDDLNIQHLYLSPEYIAALYDKGAISMFAETGAEYAPGFYSAPFGVARTIAGRPLRRRLTLLRKVALIGGYVYDSVIYEGYISFFRLNPKAKILNLILPDIKTDFDTAGKATDSVDFNFKFDIKYEE